MTIDDLKETAALAHLNLNESELAAALPAFEQMLEYFAVMQAAEEDRTVFPENDSQAVNSGFFRPDSAGMSSNSENLINNAGKRDGRFLVIPNVL